MTTKLWIEDAGYEKTKKAFERSLNRLQLESCILSPQDMEAIVALDTKQSLFFGNHAKRDAWPSGSVALAER